MKPSLLALALSAIVTTAALAAPSATLVIEQLKNPVYLTAPSESNDYLYILEKEGVIQIYDRKSKKLLKTPFLDIKNKIKVKMNEQGLLGMAFSPNFDSDKRFYLYYTDKGGDTKVARYTTSSKTQADKSSEEILLSQDQDFKNHNGGWIDFGPDGMLYIGLGDGGSANDKKQRAQDLTSLLGKLLRIDVSGPESYQIPKDNPFYESKKVRPEILSYGLRNPWRCAWEGQKLIIADVGQNAWEEINAVDYWHLFSANFGWPQLEGTHKTKNPMAKNKNPGKIIEPVYEYKHDSKNTGGFSITGGAVYHGSVKELQGRYIFADYVRPHIWSAEITKNKFTDIKHHKADFSQNGKEIKQVVSFGTDPQGEMYIISNQGKIYQIVE
jgi:glucose/arabinose dehydrogenase